MRNKSFLAILALLVLATAIALAQSKTGKVQGLVRDESKALVPGASVSLTNVETKAVQRALSAKTGEFAFDAPTGVYEVRAELPGFETAMVPNVRLNEGQTVQVDLVM